uniref:Extracellular globin n=1 Tax=Arenicola marina TaxID=6344 RepID=Q2PAD5_AREMA|nr:haemoglobin A2c chain precursor [Arenicola marina]
MKVLIVLMACLAYVAADCGPLQRLKVKHQWVQVYSGHGYEREAFGREVFLEMYNQAPKAKDLFTRVRGENVFSPEFGAHMVRVLGGLDMCIALLSDDTVLNAQLAHLSTQHKDRGIPNEYFDVMKVALMKVVPGHVSHFDFDAWSACYDVIANGIKH